MSNDVEHRLKELEVRLSSQQAGSESGSQAIDSRRNSSRHRTSAIIMGVVVALIFGTGSAYWAHNSKSDTQAPPITASIINKVDYPLYYPSRLPEGYAYVQSSAGVSNGMVTYTLRNGDDTLTVIQQKAPVENVKLDSLPGFSPTGTQIGQAFIGTAAGQSVAVIKTLTTMINVTASDNVPKSVLADVTSALKPANE